MPRTLSGRWPQQPMQQGCVKSLFQRLREVKSQVQGHCKLGGEGVAVMEQPCCWAESSPESHIEAPVLETEKNPGNDNYH